MRAVARTERGALSLATFTLPIKFLYRTNVAYTSQSEIFIANRHFHPHKTKETGIWEIGGGGDFRGPVLLNYPFKLLGVGS